MLEIWNMDRQFKQKSREMATSFNGRKSALFMPADTMKCVLTAERTGMISKDRTKLFLVERDKIKCNSLRTNLEISGWDKQSTIFNGALEKAVVPSGIDYAWIDLNGTVTASVAQWMEEELVRNLEERAVLCLTQEYCWRGNCWLDKVRDNALSNYRRVYAKFRQDEVIFGNRLLSIPAFILRCVTRQFEVRMFEPYRYSDTVDMVLFRVELGGRLQVPTFPSLSELVGFDNSVQRSPSMRKTISMNEVVSAFANAKNPAFKAHATRKLNAYVTQQKRRGLNEARVRATVKACVTKATS